MVSHTLWASHIDERVYLGDLNSSENLPSQVTHVISLLSKQPSLPADNMKRKHLFIAAGDEECQDLLSVFPACYKFIRTALKENSTNEVLIHCRAGRSRSATIATMYLMRAHKLSYRKAVKYLMERRPLVKINEGFKKQLKIFDELLKECKWNESCSCSICHSQFGIYEPQTPIIMNGNVKKSSSCENSSTLPASKIKKSPSFEINFRNIELHLLILLIFSFSFSFCCFHHHLHKCI